jgi:elongation factor Ts
MVSIDKIKELRNRTGVSIGECKKALKKSEGDIDKAEKHLQELGKKVVQDRMDKEASAGIIDSYIHSNGKIGVLLELGCETDFVARSDDFQNLAHELCLQIASPAPEDTPLLERKWVKDSSKTIKDLIEEVMGKLGEKIVVKKFVKYEL